MTDLFVFRHGETEYNREERIQGQIDVPLNDRGRAQARELVPILGRHAPEIVLASDLARARETAQIVASALGLPVCTDPRLREVHLGEAQGLLWSRAEELFGVDFVRSWRTERSGEDVTFPGGETNGQVIRRVLEALEDHLCRRPSRRVAVATHGGVIRRLWDRMGSERSRPAEIPNATVYHFRYDPSSRQFSMA